MKQIYDNDGQITKEGKLVYQEIGNIMDNIYKTYNDVHLRELRNVIDDSNHDTLLNFLLGLDSR